MAKPENPGNGNEGNNGNDGGNEGNDDAAHVVFVVTDDETFRYEGTSHIAVGNAGALLVGKGPVATFAPTEWLRAWTEPLVAEPKDP